MNDNDKQRGPENGGGNPWMKSLLIWVGILLGLALFVTMVDGRPAATGGNQIAYSTFLDKIDEGTVRDVNISRDIITGTTTAGEKFRAYPLQDATLVQKLREKGVTITAKPEDGPSIWTVLLYQSLPFLLFLGIAFFVLRQMQKGGGANGAMGFGKSRAKLLTQKEGKVTFDDVAGIDEAREELTEIVDFLKDPSKFARLGGKIPKGALLVGSPGTGKTLLARAVAHHTDCAFIRVSGSELVQKYIGEGSRMVRELFVMAREHAPSIIFMDEIDSIGSSRGESGSGGGDSEVQRTMLELLNQLDGFEATKDIKVIMATNRIDILDAALLRPGRIDRKIEFPPPGPEARVSILRIHSRKVRAAACRAR